MAGELHRTDMLERAIYGEICRHDGIKAREIAKALGIDHTTVNRYLHTAPFMRELCYQDAEYRWYGVVQQRRPHVGLGEFCGWYGTAEEFLAEDGETWFAELLEGCRRVGRNLNDTRGLFHSFRDCRSVMADLLRDLDGVAQPDWELCFELRMNRARYIRIYSDVLVITGDRVFSLEFKMKDRIEPEEVAQAAKYSEYLEVLFGADYDVIPCLVLTAAADLFTFAPLGKTDAVVPVCSGDMLFNVFDEYMGFLQR